MLPINIINKITSDIYGETYLLYDKKHNRIFFANAQLKSYISKITNLKTINNIYYKDDFSTILEFKIKLITIDKDNNKKVEIDFFRVRCKTFVRWEKSRRKESKLIPVV